MDTRDINNYLSSTTPPTFYHQIAQNGGNQGGVTSSATHVMALNHLSLQTLQAQQLVLEANYQEKMQLINQNYQEHRQLMNQWNDILSQQRELSVKMADADEEQNRLTETIFKKEAHYKKIHTRLVESTLANHKLMMEESNGHLWTVYQEMLENFQRSTTLEAERQQNKQRKQELGAELKNLGERLFKLPGTELL